MAFRDDREALRQRAEALRRELDATERALVEKLGRAEDADRLQQELHEARAWIQCLEAGRSPRSRTALLVVGLLVLVAALVAMVGFVFISAMRGLVDPGSARGLVGAVEAGDELTIDRSRMVRLAQPSGGPSPGTHAAGSTAPIRMS